MSPARMGTHSATSCLSAEPHDDAIKDPLVHYLGCTKFDDRKKLRGPDHDIWKWEKEHQENLEAARGTPKMEIKKKAEESVKAIRERWVNNFDKELRRIEVLRKAFEAEELAKNPVSERNKRDEKIERQNSDKKLVMEVNECREAWKIDAIKTKKAAGIDCSRTVRYGAPDDGTIEANATAINQDPTRSVYVPEKDVSVGIIQFENSEPFNEDCQSFNKSVKSINGKRGLIWGEFPDQKTSVQSLLREGKSDDPEQNLLHKDRIHDKLDRIRYFHIPSNNMIWAEEAISRYFGETRLDLASFQLQLGRRDKTKSAVVLQDRYWRGQLQADERGPPHARYMSPICETIQSNQKNDPSRMEKEPETKGLALKNMVLFMPYLHWETSKKREYFASEMDDIMAEASVKKTDREKERKEERIKERGGLKQDKIKSKPQQGHATWARVFDRVKTIFPPTLRTTAHPGARTSKQEHQTDDYYQIYGKVLQAFPTVKRLPYEAKSSLGKYLMAVAKLYEGMANYRDKMLLRKYLSEDPPLHPRRTLDQAFYWTLRSTKKRDCDQVVFRGTTTKPDDFHRFDPKAEEWPKHVEYEIEGTCQECTFNIQKLSRVVMVDQLWMWILDSKTIITCFPKRYGANKNDASGIHKSIRSRLEEIGSVRTVFELGLIILDECSKTFFDRTRTLDRRPQVINEFARAIGNIMHEQSVAFNRLWWWTEQMKLVYCSKGYTDTSNLRMALLDINPEGRLDKEIEDIIEELDIMIHLANTHQEILKKFVEQAEHILNPKGEFKNNDEPQQSSGEKTGLPLSDPEREREKRVMAFQTFKQKADEVQARALDHIRELEKLRQSAKKTADDVLHLLSMKQQQASVFQAWQAMKQSDETIKQGQSIMTFTLVTIVFLPLSFLSSVFGMNNVEFGSGNWHISRQIIYIFSISAGVVFFSLLLAFSSWIRAFIWSFYVRTSTAGVVRLGFYDIYLGRPTERIYEDAARKIHRAKRDRRKEYFDRRWEKRKEKDRLEKEMQDKKNQDEDAEAKKPTRAHWPWSLRDGGSVPAQDPENGTQRSTNGTHDSTSTSNTLRTI